MASAGLNRRVEKVVGYPPLVEMSDQQRREFHEALPDAGSFEDLPGKWQAAILQAEQNRPSLHVIRKPQYSRPAWSTSDAEPDAHAVERAPAPRSEPMERIC